ncbi:MAG: hypothetical protein OXD29_14825 [Roseovarius sp.]|nr:hypothetical protein [Roseovarius sp.]MCY4291137.1 hypothetical protein [Roseovarius sp.]MCY4314667.1 hypothetical protein [Roseovarius sp.]
MNSDALDPKALIREAYRMDGITDGECRSIFLDWALSLPGEADSGEILKKLFDQYNPDHPGHPMTRVIEEGLDAVATPRRKGGWRSRERN